jgi:hypothetical protein
LTQLDHNVYVRGSEKDSSTLIVWSPVVKNEFRVSFESLESFRGVYPEYSAHSRSFVGDIALFKSRELGKYELLPAFPGLKAASSLPEEIRKLLGIQKKDGGFVGAYPPLP